VDECIVADTQPSLTSVCDLPGESWLQARRDRCGRCIPVSSLQRCEATADARSLRSHRHVPCLANVAAEAAPSDDVAIPVGAGPSGP
jgi:hypothetical protein